MAVPPLKWLRVYNWEGGVNNWASAHKIGDHEAQDALNTEIRERGFLQKRKGKSAYGGATSPKAEAAVTGLVRGYSNLSGLQVRDLSGTDKSATQLSAKQIWKQNEIVYYGNDSTGAGTQLVASAGSNRMRCVQWKGNRIYIALGAGADARRWGLNTDSNSMNYIYGIGVSTAPNTPTVDQATSAGTSTAGYFSARISRVIGPGTGYGQWGESEASGAADIEPEGSHITDTEKAYKVLMSASQNHHTSEFKVYATEGGQGSQAIAQAAPMYYVGTTTVAANYTWSDGDHVFSMPYPTAADKSTIVDKNIRFMCTHNERLWCVVEDYLDRVYYSNVSFPDECPSTQWFSVGQEITGLYSFRGDLYIYTANQIHVMRGWSPEDFEATLTTALDYMGTRAPDSIASINTPRGPRMVFASDEGIYAYDGYQTEFIGEKIQGTFNSITKSNIPNFRAVNHQGRYLLAYEDERDPGNNNRVLMYDAVRDSWHPWDGWQVGAWAVWNGAEDEGELYWGQDTTGGMIYQAEQGTELCDFRHKTKYFAPAGPEHTIDLRKFQIELRADSLPINITLHYDGGSDSKSFNIPEDPDTKREAKWSNATWGDFEWERCTDDVIRGSKSVQKRCKRVAIEIESYDAEKKAIVGCSLGYTTTKERL